MAEQNSKKIAITGATLIDGTGKPPVNNSVILINGERIEVVGTNQTMAIPEGAEIIDARGKYLLPGLIDLHVHIYQSGFAPQPLKGSAMAYGGVVAMNNLRSALQVGVTTIRDVCGNEHLDLAIRDALKRRMMIGPRLYICGIGICMTGGHGSQDTGMMHEVDGPWAVRKAVREEVKAGVDWIKLLTSHRSDYPEFSQEEIDAGVDEAHRLGKKIAIHAANWKGVEMAARAGVDTIEHGSFVNEKAADLMAEKGITLVPTIWVKNYIPEMINRVREVAKRDQGSANAPGLANEDLDESYIWFSRCVEQLPKSIALAHSRGVQIGAGTDNVFPERPFAMLPEEIEMLVKHGLSNMEAIQSATQVGAKTLGKEDQFGTVTPGKFADLIMVDRNPLEDIRALAEVSWVMKEGEVIGLYPEWKRRPVNAPQTV